MSDQSKLKRDLRESQIENDKLRELARMLAKERNEALDMLREHGLIPPTPKRDTKRALQLIAMLSMLAGGVEPR